MFLKKSRHIYRCAIIGQVPMRFPWGFDEEDSRCRKLKIELAQQTMVLHHSGVSQFLTACDCGVGLYAGEIINGLSDYKVPLYDMFMFLKQEMEDGDITLGGDVQDTLDDLFAQLEADGTISARGLKPDATHYCELVFDVLSLIHI